MAEKTPGRKKSPSTKKSAKQPIPIDSPSNSAQEMTTSRSRDVQPDNLPATQTYPGIEEEIRRRAYELYEQRGRQEGFQDEDWSRAETEILARRQQTKSA